MSQQGPVVNLTGGVQVTGGAGVPTKPGNTVPKVGDMYHRTDTPKTALQRIYVCTKGGASPEWEGIV